MNRMCSFRAFSRGPTYDTGYIEPLLQLASQVLIRSPFVNVAVIDGLDGCNKSEA